MAFFVCLFLPTNAFSFVRFMTTTQTLNGYLDSITVLCCELLPEPLVGLVIGHCFKPITHELLVKYRILVLICLVSPECCYMCSQYAIPAYCISEHVNDSGKRLCQGCGSPF